jgi:hypothetical protein
MVENVKNQSRFFLASYYAGNSRRNGGSSEGTKKVPRKNLQSKIVY